MLNKLESKENIKKKSLLEGVGETHLYILKKDQENWDKNDNKFS